MHVMSLLFEICNNSLEYNIFLWNNIIKILFYQSNLSYILLLFKLNFTIIEITDSIIFLKNLFTFNRQEITYYVILTISSFYIRKLYY